MRSRFLLWVLLVAVSLYGCGPISGYVRLPGIRFVVGFGLSGDFDRYARTIIYNIGTHIPGNPNIVVQNMPGVGGLIAANYIYNRARFDPAYPDSFAIVAFSGDLPLWKEWATKGQIRFDPRKFEWIGGIADRATGRQLVFALAPGTPKALVDFLRTAFMDMIKDPAFVSVAKGNQLTPITARQLDAIAADFSSGP